MWLVRAGSVDAVPGRLSVDGDVVVFTPHGRTDGQRFQAWAIREARRLRGTPVLKLVVSEGPREVTLLLYFSKPPPVPRPGGPVGRSLLNPTRGLERAAAGMSLRAAARATRELIEEWTGAIRALRGG